MNKANTILGRRFRHEIEYKNKSRHRAIEIETDSEGNKTVYAKLFNTRIVRKKDGKIAVTRGDWPTRTTTGAINACLPHPWRVASGYLYTPAGNKIPIGADWVELEEPAWYTECSRLS